MNGEGLGPWHIMRSPKLNQKKIRYLSNVGVFVIGSMMIRQEVVDLSYNVTNGNTRGTPMTSHAPSLRTHSTVQKRQHSMKFTEKIALQITGIAQVQWTFNNFLFDVFSINMAYEFL